MKKRGVFVIGCFLVFQFLFAQLNAQAFDRSAFYSAMAGNKIELINTQTEIVKNGSFSRKDAFEGALLMKKAGLVAKTSEKLSLFKEGHKKLDNAIIKEADNAELRFLRLMIQENAPKVVKYKADISNDSIFIKENFKQLPPEAQKAVIDYAKISKVLTPSDF